MPALETTEPTSSEPALHARLPFKPISKSHILHCSYDYWHPRYKSSVLKSRIIPLSTEFLSYLREDGIVLAPDSDLSGSKAEDAIGDDGWNDQPEADPSANFPTIHQKIKDIIAELGGLIAPKLNWSAPKDATWIMMKKNSMECSTPNDVYLLLKSSDFITHDLDHAFDGCAQDASVQQGVQYVLVLRKWFKVNPSCEFRCFVRERRLLGICQRDLNHFDFLFPLIPKLRKTIQNYFDETLQNTFPDENFVFDIYLPDPHDRVRLMDINPWAPRTDPLLFSWLELLTIPMPKPLLGVPETSNVELPMSSSDEDTQDEEAEDIEWTPELRLVKHDDPEAYSFATPQYSAHKLPKEVVEASTNGESGMREFAQDWKRMMDGETVMQNGNEGSDTEDEISAR